MAKKDYSSFISHMLYDMNLRRILMTDIYETKAYLNTEYLVLFSEGNSRIYHLFHDFSLDKKLEFYLYLDLLTYLPFERLGYDYLNSKLMKVGRNVIEFKYNKIMDILKNAEFVVNEEIEQDIKYFLNNYYNDLIEINIIGFAIIILRLFHRYVTMMNVGTFKSGTMRIQKEIGIILDKLVNDVNENKLQEININDYLPEFDYSINLNDNMIKYLEYCLEQEK